MWDILKLGSPLVNVTVKGVRKYRDLMLGYAPLHPTYAWASWTRGQILTPEEQTQYTAISLTNRLGINSQAYKRSLINQTGQDF